jgi:steroid delta-isomerase-like uncharacterized protein
MPVTASSEETRRVMEAYGVSRDTDLIAPDAVFIDTATGRQYVGREANATMLRRLYNDAFQARVEAASLVIAPGKAVLEGYLVGVHTGEFAGVPASGIEVRVPLVIAYDVSDGLIQRARVYLQVASLLQQATSSDRHGPV